MPQPNWIQSAWGWASAIPHNFTAPARRSLPSQASEGIANKSSIAAPPFPDVNANHWASDYIQTLADLRIISGFPDGSFRPDAPVTRAQFAAILRNAFPADVDLRSVKPFSDVAPSYWATSAISTTRATGFLSGYPGNRFRPEQNIPRVQALVALANGLGYTAVRAAAPPIAQNDGQTAPQTDAQLLSYYQDRDAIPAYAIPSLAAATDLSLVVNYPNLRQLNPNRNASRAEIAAFVYQALYQAAKAPPLSLNPYRVIATSQPWQTQPKAILPVQAAQLSFNGPGTRLATLNQAGDLIQVWESETGQLLRSINALSGSRLEAIALSEDGEIAIALTQRLSSQALTLQAWNITTGQSLWQRAFEAPSAKPQGNVANAASPIANAPILGLAIRPRYNEILTQASFASAPADQPVTLQLRLHSLETGEITQTLSATPAAQLFQFSFSPKGEYLAALGRVTVKEQQPNSQQLIDIWQLSDGSRFPNLPINPNGSSNANNSPNLNYFTLAFTPNGSLRTLGQNLDDIQLDSWDIRSGQRLDQITTLPGIDRQDRLGLLSPDGVWYFVRSDVVGTRLIDTQLSSALPLDAFAQRTAFSGKGGSLALVTQTTTEIFTQQITTQ